MIKTKKILKGYKSLLVASVAVLAFSVPAMAADTDTTLGDDSAYTLTEVSSPGENVITKYIYDSVNGELTPVYYEVSLKQTTYGEGNDSKTFRTVNGINGGTFTIKADYDSSNTYTERQTSLSDDVDSNFVGIDYTLSSGTSLQGGAINNNSEITIIIGNFIGNNASNTNTTAAAYGAAIYNGGVIGNVISNFISNYVTTIGSTAGGGAICNNSIGKIGDINGDFIGNYGSSSSGSAYGGAIYNNSNGEIGDINGDFIGNYGSSSSGNVYGGAIYSGAGSTIGNITGDFIGNFASTDGGIIQGGAICNNRGTISSITGDFIGNHAESSGNYVYGGAICNIGNTNTGSTIGNIKSDFIGNFASTSGSYAYGGAIANYYGTIGDVTGDFSGNYASTTSSSSSALGGAICNWSNSSIGNIEGNFLYNYASTTGTNARGGAIFNNNSTIGDITGDFIGNYAESTGTSYAYGGAIYNTGTIGSTDEEDNITGGIINSSFYNNYAQSESGDAKGGAIYTTEDLNLVSTNGYTMVFDGNYTDSAGTVDDNAIYVDNSDASLNFNLTNGGKLILNDNVDGVEGYQLKLSGDETGTAYINNDIKNADITHESVTSYLDTASYLNNNNSLDMASGTMNIPYMDLSVINFRDFNIGDGDIIINAIDVDLANETMGHFMADNTSYTGDGSITVNGLNLLTDSKEAGTTYVYFAQDGIMDSVKSNVASEVMAPIFKYDVSYETRNNDGGYFKFSRGNTADSFNPAVLTAPVAAQAGAYTAMTTAFDYAFEHSDYFMKLPGADRLSLRNENKYAISDTSNLVYRDNEFTTSGGWFKPYTSFENIPLKNGPKVDTISYGALFGFDTEFKEHNNGWGSVFTGYAGYNGSSQSFTGVDTFQNGGLLGLTETFYKNNFYTALTASAGASVGESSNMYGHENFTMLMAGIASKTGYSIEFKEGKYVILPTFLMSYTFVNTFDYTNAAGVRIKSDPLHAIQINPNVRFIANTEKGWQPYATVGMVWNIMDKTKFTANEVVLPQMSIKPYVEYGVGIQKRWRDKFAGYAQAVMRNGGRTGIAFTFGFRWAIGRDNKPKKNVDSSDL